MISFLFIIYFYVPSFHWLFIFNLDPIRYSHIHIYILHPFHNFIMSLVHTKIQLILWLCSSSTLMPLPSLQQTATKTLQFEPALSITEQPTSLTDKVTLPILEEILQDPPTRYLLENFKWSQDQLNPHTNTFQSQWTEWNTYMKQLSQTWETDSDLHVSSTVPLPSPNEELHTLKHEYPFLELMNRYMNESSPSHISFSTSHSTHWYLKSSSYKQLQTLPSLQRWYWILLEWITQIVIPTSFQQKIPHQYEIMVPRHICTETWFLQWCWCWTLLFPESYIQVSCEDPMTTFTLNSGPTPILPTQDTYIRASILTFICTSIQKKLLIKSSNKNEHIHLTTVTNKWIQVWISKLKIVHAQEQRLLQIKKRLIAIEPIHPLSKQLLHLKMIESSEG